MNLIYTVWARGSKDPGREEKHSTTFKRLFAGVIYQKSQKCVFNGKNSIDNKRKKGKGSFHIVSTQSLKPLTQFLNFIIQHFVTAIGLNGYMTDSAGAIGKLLDKLTAPIHNERDHDTSNILDFSRSYINLPLLPGNRCNIKYKFLKDRNHVLYLIHTE